MPERSALFHPVANRRWRAKPDPASETGAASGTASPSPAKPKSAAKPKPKPRSKGRSAAAATSKPRARGAANATTTAPRTPAPEPAPWYKRPFTSARPPARPAPPKREAEPKTPANRRTTARPRPRPPVLQRRSLGSLLARGAVLALALVAMVGFAVVLARATLVPSPASVDLVHTNLRPGASIRAYLDQPALRDTVKQIGGNILLGVPFGVLLPMLFPHTRGVLRVAGLTALVMVVVETFQGAIVEGRAFDIDDVILNTAGALLGYLLLGRRLGRALHPRREHWWHRLGFGTAPGADEGGAAPAAASSPSARSRRRRRDA